MTQKEKIFFLKRLPPAENELFWKLFEDKGTKEIAGDLRKNIRTVSSQARSIYQRLGVATRIGLILRWFEEEIEDKILTDRQ